MRNSIGEIILTGSWGETLTIPGGNRDFFFTTALPAGSTYTVELSSFDSTNPNCVLNNPTGTGHDENINDLEIICTLPAGTVLF